MYTLLLFVHGGAGAVALAGAVGAIGSRLFGWPHRVHILSGNAFTVGMIGVALTGLVITWISPSLFLLSLAVFLLYLVIAGWRYAKSRKGLQSAGDKIFAIGFALIFVLMIIYGAWRGMGGNAMGWVMAVFGTIGLLQALADARGAFGEPVKGKTRIAAHLTRMLGGTIGVTTAFLLIQFQTNSVWVWLGPTALLTPLILVWSRRVRGGWLPKRVPILKP